MGTINRGSAGWNSKNMSIGVGTKPKLGVKVSPNYRACSNTFQSKIHSFKTLFNQTCGAAKKTRPSTAVLNSFANWINKGAIIQTCSKAQVAKWAKTKNKTFDTRTATTGSCKTILCAKFGKPTIKAVARTKSGSFLVATAPKLQGKTFCFPK